uniref:DUF4781 domain-containing protein n=1 Tax=Panagrolaimus sp. ES5 TaxID=591445 RepID=A0AC34FDT8_9BILA
MEIEELLKEKSSLTHNFNYQAFADRLYDNYDVPNGHDLLTLKVCYAIYGPPKVATTTLVKAYPKADYERGYLVQEKIFNLICDNRIREKSVGIIFVYCYMSDEKQFVLPIFRVKFPSSKNNTDVAKYVDLDCRVYNSWEDWKSNNTLPPMKYSYPKNGYYSCSEDKYMFDSSSAPVLGYGEPRSSSFESKVFSVSNVSAAAVSTATAGLTVASLFMPLAAGPLLFCQYVGPAAAAYSSVR